MGVAGGGRDYCELQGSLACSLQNMKDELVLRKTARLRADQERVTPSLECNDAQTSCATR